jgi:hypothetical protein
MFVFMTNEESRRILKNDTAQQLYNNTAEAIFKKWTAFFEKEKKKKCACVILSGFKEKILFFFSCKKNFN